MKHGRRLLVAPLLLAAAALSAQDAPPPFPTTPEASPEIVRATCAGGPTRGVSVLRNADGAVGAYVAVPSIMDSPIRYYDAAGKGLTVFHIFDSDAGKAASSAIVKRLSQEFPRQEFVACAARGG